MVSNIVIYSFLCIILLVLIFLIFRKKPNDSFTENNNKINIMVFTATWCGHCTTFRPTWERLQSEFNNDINFINYDSDKDKDTVTKWKIRGFPTIIFQDGETFKVYSGKRDYETLVPKIKQVILENNLSSLS
jgi:thiol-disulfide isomerase/thioredoxin